MSICTDGLKSLYITGKNFRFCINITEKPLIISENKNQRWRTLYYYGSYGAGKIYDNNDPSNYEMFLLKNLLDVNKFVDCETVSYESYCPSELIGFNTTNQTDIWEAELIDINQTSIKCEYSSVVFCFNGTMKVNNKIFNKYNFACLDKNIEYMLELNDTSEIGLFKLIQ